MVGVYILSDNRLFRESLARIFSKKSDIEVVCSRQFCPDVAEDILASTAEILLLDSATFLQSGASRLTKSPPAHKLVKILMVGMEDDETVFLEAVRRGVFGYVPKEASAMDVVAAVRSVAQGEAVCPPHLCRALFDFVAHQECRVLGSRAGAHMGLTRREEQLIPLIDQGLTNKEIAAQLNISEKTVKNHVHRILRKAGVESRVSLSAACHLRRNDERGNTAWPLH